MMDCIVLKPISVKTECVWEAVTPVHRQSVIPVKRVTTAVSILHLRPAPMMVMSVLMMGVGMEFASIGRIPPLAMTVTSATDPILVAGELVLFTMVIPVKAHNILIAMSFLNNAYAGLI